MKITRLKQKEILYVLEESYPNSINIGSLKSHIKEEDEFLEFDLDSLKGESFIKESASEANRFICLTEKGMEYTRNLREKEYREKQQLISYNQTKFNGYLVVLYFVIALSGLAILIPIQEIKYPIFIVGAIIILCVPFDYLILPLIKKYKEHRKREEFRVKTLKSF